MADNDKKNDDKAEEETPAAAAPKKKLPLGLIGALVLGAGASGAFFLFKPQPKTAAAKTESAAKHGEATHSEAVRAEPDNEGAIIAMPPFIVNLTDEEQVSYLKCTLAVELANKDLAVALEKKSVPIRNAVILYLSSLAAADTRGTKNKEKILANVSDRVSSVLGKDSVVRIYISEFVIQ